MTLLPLLLAVVPAFAGADLVPFVRANCYATPHARGLNAMYERIVNDEGDSIHLSFKAAVVDCDAKEGNLSTRVRDPYYRDPAKTYSIEPLREGLAVRATRLFYEDPFTPEAGSVWRFDILLPKWSLRRDGRNEYRFYYHFSPSVTYAWRIVAYQDGASFEAKLAP